MKQIFTLLMAVLVCIPAIGRQTVDIRKVPGNKNRNDRSALCRVRASHHIKQAMRDQKTALILMQQLDRIIYQEYDTESENWVDYSRSDYLFNASGQNTSATESYFNPESGNYVPDEKWSYSYTGSNMVEMLISSWDSSISQWEFVYKSNFTYNPDGTIASELESLWDGSSWQPMGKTENTYDAGGNLITELFYYWYEDTSEWVVSGKTDNIYNANGSILLTTNYFWDPGTSDWIGTYREEYTYNSNWQLLVINYLTWESAGSQWINDYRDEFTYDEFQNISRVTGTQWMEGIWYLEYKNEFTYNNNFSFNDLVLPYDFTNETGLFNHMITQVSEFEYDGSVFVEIDRSIVYYSEVNITGITTIAAGNARIFPQPASDLITFSWDSRLPFLDLTVYDINGRKVMAQTVGNKVPVQADQLAPGLYFYRLTGNNQTEYTGKLSIK